MPDSNVDVSPELIGELSKTLVSAQTVEQLTRPLLELLELVTGLESTYLTRIDETAGQQIILYSRNSKIMQIPEGLSVPWSDTLCKRALEEGRLYTDNVAACWGDSDAARNLGIQTYASTPVYLDDQVLYGTLCAASMQSQPISPQGRQVLLLFSTLIAQQIQRENLVERLQKLNAALEMESTTDALTGLPNRRFTLAALHRLFGLAQRTNQRVLIAFIDLDGFKSINDTYGHEAGDAFLIEIGRRLSSGLKAHDVVGRLGGDEFIIIGLTDSMERDEQHSVELTRQRFAPLTQGRFALGACTIDYPGASVGIITADPLRISPDEAIRKADAQMYIEKKRRRGVAMR